MNHKTSTCDLYWLVKFHFVSLVPWQMEKTMKWDRSLQWADMQSRTSLNFQVVQPENVFHFNNFMPFQSISYSSASCHVWRHFHTFPASLFWIRVHSMLPPSTPCSLHLVLVAHLSSDKGWQRNGCLTLACSRFKMEDHIKSALVSIHTWDGEPNAKTVGLVTWAPLGDMSQSRPISIFEQSYRGKRRSLRHMSLLSLHANAWGSSLWANSCDVRQTGIGKTGSLELLCASKMCHWSQCGSSMAAVSSFCTKECEDVKRVTDERWWKMMNTYENLKDDERRERRERRGRRDSSVAHFPPDSLTTVFARRTQRLCALSSGAELRQVCKFN